MLGAASVAVIATPAASHMMSAGTGSVVLRSDDAMVMLAFPASSLASGPIDTAAARAELSGLLKRSVTISVDGKPAQVLEDMLLTAEADDDHGAQVDWVARIAIGPRADGKRCVEVSMAEQILAEPQAVDVVSGEEHENIVLSRSAPKARAYCTP